MDALTLVITILQLLCGLAVIVIVLFQSGKSAGLSGAIGGVADSFLSLSLIHIFHMGMNWSGENGSTRKISP